MVLADSVAAAVAPIARGRPSTREALLNAVDELVAERGLAGCSLQAVARRAGLTTGAVYSTFGSRGALLAAAMLRKIAALGGLPVGEGDLAAAVAAYARTYYGMGAHPDGAQLMLVQLDLLRLGAADPAVAAATRDAYRQVFDTLSSDVAALVGDRDLPASPGELTYRMVAVLQGLTLQRTVLGIELGEDAFVAAALGAVGLRVPE
ncbi:MAG TPA: helix-turn-helix domain-containing protein [Mycobacteriales bacterium]|nr:helix-turn-helix domain-containing protein [Mycobacteriales bacterium]